MKLKEYRVSKKLTQTQVGDKLGIGRTTVAMWEAGLSMPRTDKLQELSKLYNCTVDDLLVALNEESNQTERVHKHAGGDESNDSGRI